MLYELETKNPLLIGISLIIVMFETYQRRNCKNFVPRCADRKVGHPEMGATNNEEFYS